MLTKLHPFEFFFKNQNQKKIKRIFVGVSLSFVCILFHPSKAWVASTKIIMPCSLIQIIIRFSDSDYFIFCVWGGVGGVHS